MDITLKARSSGDIPYDVKITVKEGFLTVRCNCQAGVFGKICKHKTELLAGDASRLYDPQDVGRLKAVVAILSRGVEFHAVLAEIKKTEAIIKAQTSLNKKAKKSLELLLNDGIRIDQTNLGM